MTATTRLVPLRGAVVVALLAAVVLFAACGGGDPSLPEQARGVLAPQVAAIRGAAAAGDRAGAQAGIDQLRAELDRLRGGGVLDEQESGRVLDAVDEVEARLALLPTPITTTTVATAPPPPPEPHDHGDRPRGKDKKKDDDDD
ncbi:MAG: hypothetical protein ACRDZ3_17280 [Acidimicrobiia bacterium]